MRALTLAVAIVAMTATSTASALNEQEQRSRLEYQAMQGTHAIEQLGAIYVDEQLEAYLQSVLNKLYPDYQGKLRVRAFKSDVFNAFALANGDLYFNIGTLLRLDNEAELASILAHEGAHVTRDHIYRWTRDTKITMPMLTVVGGAFGAPALGQLVGVSSVMGMSREHEREADESGFERMVKAGYDPSAGAATFKRLLGELELLKIKQPFMFASHPRVRERIANFESFAKNAASGEQNRDIFNERTLNARLEALKGIWKSGNGKLLVYLLDSEKRLDALPGHCRFYLAEGYRLRNAEGDADKAEAIYAEVLRDYPEFAPTYAAVGQRRMRSGNRAEALAMFRRFLDLDRDSPDRAFIEQYVTLLEKEMSQ